VPREHTENNPIRAFRMMGKDRMEIFPEGYGASPLVRKAHFGERGMQSVNPLFK
jgi:hypothetical protein